MYSPFLIPELQLLRLSVFQLLRLSVFQLFRLSVFQLFSLSAFSLDPQLPIQSAILDRLGDVMRLDLLSAFEIGNRA